MPLHAVSALQPGGMSSGSGSPPRRHPAPDDPTSSLTFLPAAAAAVRSQARAPTTSDVGNVTDVGLKDVPLRSLFPDEPSAPAPVRPRRAPPPSTACAAWGSGMPAVHGTSLCIARFWVFLLTLGASQHRSRRKPPPRLDGAPHPHSPTASRPCHPIHPPLHSTPRTPACRARPSCVLPSWAAGWRGCPPLWSCWTRGTRSRSSSRGPGLVARWAFVWGAEEVLG